MGRKRLSPEEVKALRMYWKVHGDIRNATKIFGCSESCVYSHVSAERRRSGSRVREQKLGRPTYWTPERESVLQQTVEQLTTQDDQDQEVTAKVIKEEAAFTCSESSVRRQMNKLGFFFRRPAKYSDLTKQDIEGRADFCQKHDGRTAKYWENTLFVDEKSWVVRMTKQDRARENRKGIRGVYRRKNEARKKGMSRPRKGDLAPRSLKVLGGFLGNRVCLWDYFDGGMTSEKFVAAIKKLARKHKFKRIVLDQHKAHTARSTKQELRQAGFRLTFLPKRSPEFMPLDFSIWEQTKIRLRDAEKKVKNRDKTISEAEFRKQLKRSAQGISKKAGKKIVKSLARSLKKCAAKKGGRF